MNGDSRPNDWTIGTRPVQFTKWSCEDLRGLDVCWLQPDHTIPASERRQYLARVVGMSRDESTGCVMLECRHFCGDSAPTVAAHYVRVLDRSWEGTVK